MVESQNSHPARLPMVVLGPARGAAAAACRRLANAQTRVWAGSTGVYVWRRPALSSRMIRHCLMLFWI